MQEFNAISSERCIFFPKNAGRPAAPFASSLLQRFRRCSRNTGGLTANTPHNAKTVGIPDRGKHRMEKVIFESRPKFYVNANLHIPSAAPGPFPAILFPHGP